MSKLENAPDLFYQYLEYNENVELIGPGEYVEIHARNAPLAWTRLMIDLLDTWRAGRLLRLRAQNGSAAYIREKGKPNGYVRQR